MTAQQGHLGPLCKVNHSGNSTVTIKHSEIKHMDMPGMTMVFTTEGQDLLSNVKPGDKVKFMVVSEGREDGCPDIQPLSENKLL